jgi:polysaccharide biosynthesis transport protein
LAQYDINLREYWRILKKRKITVLFVAIVLAVFSTAFAVFNAPTPIYTAECSIKFEKETTVEGLYAKTITWSGGDDIETQISVMKGFTIFEKVAQRLGLIPKTSLPPDSPAKGGIARVIDNLQSKVEITRQGMTNILNIKVKDEEPAFAQKLANTIAATYKDLHSEVQMKRTLEAIRYIEDQLVQVRQKLREAEEEFNRFTQNNQILSIDIQSEKLLARSQEVQNGIRKLVENQEELRSMVARLDKFIANPSSQGNFYSAKATAQYQSANDSLTELQLRRETLLKDFTPLHPEVVDAGRKILEGARKMRLLLLSQLGDLEKQEGDARSELLELESKSSAMMEKKLEYDRLKRKVELYNDMTTLLERKNQEALIKKAEKPEEVTVVKPALFPTEPINPPRTATTGLMGLVIGLVLGLIAAFIVETFDTSIGAIEDVEETLKTKVLGVIPQMDVKELHESFKEKIPEGVAEEISPAHMVNMVSHYAPKSMMAESFRGLRTNIHLKDTEKTIKTIAVTSASPQEGKTLASVNLAITMAQAGMKTLLIGSDLRKPMVARVFGVEQTPGLSEILLGNCPWRDAVQTVTSMILGNMSLDEVLMTPGLDNLHLIAGGSIPPNPAELLDSKRLREFMEEAKNEYDLILFDSPPILSAADSAILASKVDGVLFVYRVGAISRGLLKRSTAQLEQVNCPILGVILNGMKPELSPDFLSFKYYKYYSHGEEGKKGEHLKKGFQLLKGKGISAWGRSKKGGKSKRSALTLSLTGVGLILLAAGVLWHFGIVDPLKASESVNPVPSKPFQPVAQKVPPKPLSPPSASPAPQVNQESAKTLVSSAPVAQVKQEPAAEVKVQVAVEKPLQEIRLPGSPLNQESAKTPVSSAPVAQVKQAPAGEVKVQVAVEKPLKESRPPAPPVKPAGDKKAVPDGKGRESISVSQGEYPYSIYLGSLKTLDQAKRAVSLHANKGIQAYWVKVHFKEKGDWYRIYAGHFKDQQEADGFAQARGLAEKETFKTEYANLIGTYSQSKGFEERVKAISDLGYSSYTIKGGDGELKLLVGAFVTEEAAEQQRQELMARGIENRIIKR